MSTIPNRPTAEMIHAAETVFLAMAYTETIRPVVEGNQKAVLAANNYPYNPEHLHGDKYDGFVRNPKHTYLMFDADFNDYLAKVRELNTAKGLKTDNPDHCPLLVAESLQTDAEHALIDAVESVTKISHDAVFCGANALENYRKLVDLTLRWIAPFVNPKLSREVMAATTKKG